MKLSRRLSSLKPSSTVAVMNKAKALTAQGVKVLNFSAGEPDFNSPEKAKRALIASVEANNTKYLPTAGDPETRKLLAELATTQNHIPACTPDNVLITCGVKMGLYLVAQGLFDVAAPGEPQQEFVLPVPSWVSFAPIAELAGAKVVPIETTAATGFKMTPQQLKAAITPRTRAVLINSPSNPCSTMYTPAELEALAAVIDAAARTIAPDLAVIADELYQHIVFGNTPFKAVGSIAAIAPRVITVSGPGKSFAMTGWRIGWVITSGPGGKAFIDGLIKLQGQTVTAVPGFVLAGVRAALTECQSDLDGFKKQFAERAEVMYSSLKAIPGLKLAKPEGAFYAFPDIGVYLGKSTPAGQKLSTAAEFATALLETKQVAVVPGEDFGGCGISCIRMSFACSTDQIKEGCRRLAEFVAELK